MKRKGKHERKLFSYCFLSCLNKINDGENFQNIIEAEEKRERTNPKAIKIFS